MANLIYYEKGVKSVDRGKKPTAVFLAAVMLGTTALPVEAASAQKGLQPEGKNIYYYNKKGKRVANSFVKVGKQTYYFGKNGIAYSGLKKIKNSYYYFDKKSRMVRNKVVTWRGKKYYLLKNGKTATGTVMVKGKIWTVTKKGALKKNMTSLAKRGADFRIFVKEAGRPLSGVTSASCSGPGMDGIYRYTNFTVYTYEENGVSTIVYIG